LYQGADPAKRLLSERGFVSGREFTRAAKAARAMRASASAGLLPRIHWPTQAFSANCWAIVPLARTNLPDAPLKQFLSTVSRRRRIQVDATPGSGDPARTPRGRTNPGIAVTRLTCLLRRTISGCVQIPAASVILSLMAIDTILAQIDQEIARLRQARSLLTNLGSAAARAAGSKAKRAGARPRRKRVLSAEARKRIADAQRKRWAAQRAKSKGK
jgi:hypothetical protein